MPICWGSSRDTLHFGTSLTTSEASAGLHNSHYRGCAVRACTALLDSRPQNSLGRLALVPLRDLAISTPSSQLSSVLLCGISLSKLPLLIHLVYCFPFSPHCWTQFHCRVGRSL